MSSTKPLEPTPSVRYEIDVATHVAVVEFVREPTNSLDRELLVDILEAYRAVEEAGARAIVLCSAGRVFCSGADPHALSTMAFDDGSPHIYDAAVQLFDRPLPVVAAVQGPAIGAGLGLALSADFRVAATTARFSANFARLGLHQGFGISVTLPEVVGRQAALDLLLSGRRIDGAAALATGLVDELVDPERLRESAVARASTLAECAPLAVRSIRSTMRGDLAARVRAAVAHEREEQARLQATEDFAEGTAAAIARRTPNFVGR
ncbi:enoyl-CoA hydratase/isomerase family protein [Streptomyces sp. NPDC051985]|uniref:enoyl-CoA hydratase/isomerase family protein n=1 Tax=Streptomyces sp. NPDC051985 TaxID=3155807 RepID=UPI003447EDDC